MSYDYNNIYGWDMSLGFEWVQPANVPDLNTLNEGYEKRYFLVVDLEYP